MNPEDRKKALDKIKKCLRLSSSANENEAAAALRQARKLMSMYHITDDDVLASEASEASANARCNYNPPMWENALAQLVADAFQCKVFFAASWRRGTWRFVGCGAAPELSQFAFEVLLRQLKRARSEYLQTRLKRCKPYRKTQRADVYCVGWVSAVRRQVEIFAQSDQQCLAIEKYLEINYPDLCTHEVQLRRKSGKGLNAQESEDYFNGRKQGAKANLHRPMGRDEQAALQGACT